MSQWLKLSLLTNDCNKSKNSVAQLLLRSVTQNKIYPEVRYFNKKKKKVKLLRTCTGILI